MTGSTVKAVIIGHATGDALGVPAEFCERAELAQSPLTDMEGFGTYPYPAGTWSDDTSMSLCALDVLKDGKCDFNKIMYNFGKWLAEDEYTATGETFDVGNACKNAIIDYHAHKMGITECGQREEYSNGNGSLMRINPFVLYLLAKDGEINKNNLSFIYRASMLTHAHSRAMLGCGIYACVLEALINIPTKASAFMGLAKAKLLMGNEEEIIHYNRIFQKNFARLPREEIKSGGYVVHTLEAAIWCLLNTDNYRDCVLCAVNLGGDTDTVAAVAGGLAGALYGYSAIPEKWRSTLERKDYIEEMCKAFTEKNLAK